jgi:type I restriction enzyme M protein
MILHGISGADLRNGDTLGEPLHVQGGELMRYDRVITNPPFSQNYSADGIPFAERFSYGFCPEKGKKADLMFLQHMVAVLRQGGMVCTVMPHGVLFRGGAEKEIRKGFIGDDLLDAVIGLAPNLFYGTGIPACILVLRAKGSKPSEHQGKVLFINADAEYRAGRAQNYLEPEHVEKIVNAYNRYEDIPGFATVVAHGKLAENGYNLNIRRYADNAPPPEPHDVRAHLLGGIPKAEVKAKTELFGAHGFEPRSLLVERGESYYEFTPDLNGNGDLKALIESDEGLRAQEKALYDAFAVWWNAHQGEVADLPKTQALMALRADLLASFEQALVQTGLLDRFKVVGSIATWWGDVVFDLKTLMARGFEGVIESWVTTILNALVESGNKSNPLDHKLVKQFLPEYLDEIAETEGLVAELNGTIKAASAKGEDGDTSEDEGDNEEAVSEAELKALKKKLSAAKLKVKAAKKGFADRLEEAQAQVDAEQAQVLVLDILRADLLRELERRVTAHRQEVVSTVENWWDKYRVTLRDIEGERDTAKVQLDGFLKGLGYGR